MYRGIMETPQPEYVIKDLNFFRLRDFHVASVRFIMMRLIFGLKSNRIPCWRM